MIDSYQCTALPNGLRVASEYMPSVETISLVVSVGVGARYESVAQGGLSHFLEHMAFKGTATRTARQIAESFDDMGGMGNAYTSLENTVYYTKTLANDLPIAMDIIADILQNSTFVAEELERERGVILQEIAMQQDTPDDLVFDYFQATAFPDQPIGRSILGLPTQVEKFKRDELMEYMHQHYQPSNMVLTVVGNLKHDEVLELAKQHFSELKDHSKPAKDKAGNYQGGTLLKQRKLEQVHITLGWNGINVHDDDFYAYQAFSTILGGGMSSRLFQEIREKRGLAYHVQSFNSSYADCGIFGMYAATDEKSAKEIIPVMRGELEKLTIDATEKELARAKKQMLSSLLMTRESTSSVAEWIGKHLLTFNRYRQADELAKRIESLTIKDIKQVGDNLLKNDRLTIAALGEVSGIKGT